MPSSRAPPEDAAVQTKRSNKELDVRSYFRKHGRNVWDREQTDGLAEIIKAQGVPDDLRAEMWLTLSGGKKIMLQSPSNFYSTIVAKSEETNDRDNVEQIDKDVERTSIQRLTSRVAGTLKVEKGGLRRILVATSIHLAHVGYCQSMNLLAAFLLMHLEEEEAFWVLVALIQKFANYYSPKMSALLIDQRAFAQLVDDRLPAVSEHLRSLDVTIPIMFQHWFMCLYVNVYTPDVTQRIWDIMFLRGSSVLFEVGLCLLALASEQITRCTDVVQLLAVVDNVSKSVGIETMLAKLQRDPICEVHIAAVQILRTHFQRQMESEEARELREAEEAARKKQLEAERRKHIKEVSVLHPAMQELVHWCREKQLWVTSPSQIQEVQQEQEQEQDRINNTSSSCSSRGQDSVKEQKKQKGVSGSSMAVSDDMWHFLVAVDRTIKSASESELKMKAELAEALKQLALYRQQRDEAESTAQMNKALLDDLLHRNSNEGRTML